MEFRLDKSLYDLGIKNVVIGIAKNVDPHADLPLAFLKKKEEREKWALECDVKEVQESPVIQGYRQLLQRVGRSVKKNPPTVVALIRNIQHRGSLPHINSIIDIYNVEALSSLLAIGGHDLDKIGGQIEFSVSQREDIFLPILSTEKHVAQTDYVYRDENGVLAWLDVRDSEHYKFDEDTNIIINRKLELGRMINKLSNPKHRTILRMTYINKGTADSICYDLKMSRTTYYRLKNEAISALEEVI